MLMLHHFHTGAYAGIRLRDLKIRIKRKVLQESLPTLLVMRSIKYVGDHELAGCSNAVQFRAGR